MAAGTSRDSGSDRRQPSSGKKAVSGKGSSGQHAPLIEDPRFVRLHTDPRFLRPTRDDTKIALDERFKSLLQKGGKAGGAQRHVAKTDKYGRRGPQRSQEDDLERLYRLEQEGSGSGSGSESSGDEEEHVQSGRPVDFARGEGQLESSGDEDSEISDGDQDDAEGNDSEGSDDEDANSGAGIVIGPAAARRREKNQRKKREKESEDESETQEPTQPDAEALGAVDPAQLAELDARAERTVRREASRAAKAKSVSAPTFGGDTARLAAVNMDWDHIRAIDLYKVFTSVASPAATRGFTAAVASSSSGTSRARTDDEQIVPVKGRCLSVRIYPSNFGRKRMAKENHEGPPREIFKHAKAGKPRRGESAAKKGKGKGVQKGAAMEGDIDSDSDSSEEELYHVDEGGEFDDEALRAYQLERLRYYYAIATFDSAETARYVMSAIDGTEMEHTANMFDLSFVPRDMTFPDKPANHEDPLDEGWRDEATETHAEANYEGVDFTTDALRHSRVKLTWDADDPQRSKITRQLMAQAPTADQLRDEDFKAYLASASEDSDLAASESEDERDAEDAAERRKGGRMRALLGLDDNEGSAQSNGFGKAKNVAFQDGRKASEHLSSRPEGDMEITFMPGLSEAAARKKKGEATQADETTIEKYKRKQREKRERRKIEHGDGAEGEREPAAAAAADGGKPSEVGFGDPFFVGEEDGDDIDFDKALAAEEEAQRQQRRGANGSSARGAPAHTGKEPSSALGADSDISEQDVEDGGLDDTDDEGAGHFSLKDIVKAEQAESGGKKKGRWAKKKEKKLSKEAGRSRRDGNEVQPGFEMNVSDARFAANLFGDHQYALDPSHPNFVKTKGMQKLVNERRQRQQQHERQGTKHTEGVSAGKKSTSSENLDDLIQSVKKRGQSNSVHEPRQKKRSRGT